MLLRRPAADTATARQAYERDRRGSAALASLVDTPSLAVTGPKTILQGEGSMRMAGTTSRTSTCCVATLLQKISKLLRTE
ncbi:hypothetical protein [Actinoallomurus sp. CA-142502]|uniref:hypothetical protein n=1 Tax=Actinoallomurus sp. CA-142502 TaxID=3239885 RepID=UPI003D8DBFAE